MTSNSIDLRPHFVAARNLHDISIVLKGLRNGVLEFPADKVEKPLESKQHERNMKWENNHTQSAQIETSQELTAAALPSSSSSSSAARETMVNGTPVAEQHVKAESSTSFTLPASYIPSLPLQDHGIFPDLYANSNKESIRETIGEKMTGSNKISSHNNVCENPETITVMPSLLSLPSSVEQTSEVNDTFHSEYCKENESSVFNNSFREHLEQFTMNGNLEEQEKNKNIRINERSFEEREEQEQQQQHGSAGRILSNEIQEHLPTQVLPQLSSISHELKPNKILLRKNIINKNNNNNNSQVKMLCIWDIDDTLVGSGSAGIRQHPVFKYEELRRVFKSVNGPNTRHLLLSQGSIDDILAEDGSSKLGYLREFFDVQHNSERSYVNKAKGNNSNTNTAHKENSKVRVLCHGWSSSNNNVKSSRTINTNGKETKHSSRTNKQNYEFKLYELKQREKVHSKEFAQHKSSVEENCDGVVEHSSCTKTSKKVGNNEHSVERQKREKGWFASLFTCKSVEQRSKPPSASSHSYKSTSTPSSSTTLLSPPSSLPVASSLSSSAKINNKSNHTITSSESSTLTHISEDTYLIQLNAIRHNAFYEFNSERLYTYLHNPPPWYSAPQCTSTNSSRNMTQSTSANNAYTHSNLSTERRNSNNNNHFNYADNNGGCGGGDDNHRIINNNSSIINDDYSRWLILRPEIWGITLSSLSTPIAPTPHTAFVDGRRFRKMDVIWSLAKSGNWDVVIFVDNSLCETGVTRSGAKLIDLLRYRHGSHMRNFYKAEYILLAASAKLRQMEQRLHRDVTKPLSGYERCHASYFHRARMGSFVSANITPSDMVTPAFHTAHVQVQTQEPREPTPQEEREYNINSTTTNHGTSAQQNANTFTNTAIKNDNIAPYVTRESVQPFTEITVNNICNSSDNRDSKSRVKTSNVNGVKEHDAPHSENCEMLQEEECESYSKLNTTACRANEKLLPPVILLKPQTIDASEVVDVASQRSISFSAEVMEYNTECNGELIDNKVNDITYNSDGRINKQANKNKIKSHNNPLELEQYEEEELEQAKEEKHELEEEERHHQNVPLQNWNVPGCTTNQDKVFEETNSETESFNKLTNEEDCLCGASKPVDLVIVNFHMPSTLYRSILHGCRTVTVVTTVTSQHHGSKKGSKQIMSPTTFSRYVGQPVFTSNVGCTDEQYSAVMKIFWAQLNALYQLLEEDLRVNGFVDLGRREKWRPRTSTVHFPVPVPVHELHYLSHYYQAVCDEIEQRLITPLLSGREEVQENMCEICSIAFELYEKLLYGVVFTDPVLTQHVALNLFEIYTSEKRIPSLLVKELRENVHKLLSASYVNNNNNII